MLEDCCQMRELGNVRGAASCMASALLSELPQYPDVLEYFALTPPTASPAALQRRRLPGCDDPHFNWPLVRRVAILWNRTQSGPCLWANMLPSQLAFIVKMARAFKVTHMVECGRMGGLPVLHYERFGFNVTSFELSPIPMVKEALAELVPSARQIDGDCIAGIPLHIDAIMRAEPSARVGIILDGPKGYGVFAIANKLAEKAAFIVVDDQSPAMVTLKGNHGVQPRWPYVDVGGEGWNAWMPGHAMYAALNAGEGAAPRPNGGSKTNMAIRLNRASGPVYPYHHVHDLGAHHNPEQMIMLGGHWRLRRASRLNPTA